MSSNFDEKHLKEAIVSFLLMRENLPYDLLLTECNRAIAHVIIRKYFDDEWILKYFYRDVDQQELFKFLSQPYKYYSNYDYLRSTGRMIAFANCLLNLGDIKGFINALNTIRNNTANKEYHNFESGFAELCAAKFIFLLQLQFEFNEPVGGGKSTIQGWKKNYDLKAFYPNGDEVAIEVKCMTNENAINDNSFLSVISKAIRQSANHLKKIVFIKVPESWVKMNGFYKIQNLLFYDSEIVQEIFQAHIGVFWETTEKDEFFEASKFLNLRYFLTNLPVDSPPDDPFLKYAIGTRMEKLEKESNFTTIDDLITDIVAAKFRIEHQKIIGLR